jgi:hypothetical protein
MTTHDRYAMPVDPIDWTLPTHFESLLRWEYEDGRDSLLRLYEKGKERQWNGNTRIDWSLDLDPENPQELPDEQISIFGSDIWNRMTKQERANLRRHLQAQQLSQFMHGEQGALITASQLVGAVPWTDAKYYAASQTMDEARHVEVFSRYLREKLEWEWPINSNLKRLLDIILMDSRWDFKYLGMQILVEGLAMAAFANMHQLAAEPLVKELIHYVMRDEARHVAFGVLSLKGFYAEMGERERAEREDFVIEACLLMRDRLVGEEVADAVGFDPAEVREIILESPVMQMFRQALFARVVPNVKRLGLLTPRVRRAFEEMHIIQFEDADPEAQDRALGLA